VLESWFEIKVLAREFIDMGFSWCVGELESS